MEYYEHKLDPVGVRPDWLADDDAIDFDDRDLGWDDAGHFSWLATDIEFGVRSIRIPADHWAVPALKQGFKPCLEKPADYAGGETLWSFGKLSKERETLSPMYWDRARDSGIGYVIGYKPKATTEAKPDDTSDARMLSIIERIASNGVASMTDVRECEAIVAERRPVDHFERIAERLYPNGHKFHARHLTEIFQELNLKIVEA